MFELLLLVLVYKICTLGLGCITDTRALSSCRRVGVGVSPSPSPGAAGETHPVSEMYKGSSYDRMVCGMVVRRDSVLGEIILSQADMLQCVWLPLLHPTAASHVDPGARGYFSWALASYLSVLRSSGLLVQPALCLLLFHHLVSCGEHKEVVRLLQFQFFPDSVELAIAALELSESEGIQHPTPGSAGTPGSGRKCTLTAANMLALLQQAGVDMLWRLDERSVAVRWLLAHGCVSTAIACCIKRKGNWRKGLFPSGVLGLDFYLSAVSLVTKQVQQRLHLRQQQQGVGGGGGDDGGRSAGEAGGVLVEGAYQMSVDPTELLEETRRCQLFHSLYMFLREWDAALIIPDKVGWLFRWMMMSVYTICWSYIDNWTIQVGWFGNLS